MAYSLVPDSANTVGSDLTAMKENFSLLESAQVVDEGTTADGDYIRLENGWQICKGVVELTYDNGDRLRANWNYPASFVGFVTVVGNVSPFDSTAANFSTTPDINGEIMIGLREGGAPAQATYAELQVTKVSSAPNFVNGDYLQAKPIAIGRWK